MSHHHRHRPGNVWGTGKLTLAVRDQRGLKPELVCPGPSPVPGAMYNQQRIMMDKWQNFWSKRQLHPAWAQSSEAIQFEICMEQAHIFQHLGHVIPGGDGLKQVPRPTRHMDCVLELTQSRYDMKLDRQLLKDLDQHASKDFGGPKAFNTW